MSYEIIKHIKVTEDKVFLTYASNNVYPRIYDKVECQSMSKMLQEQGREVLDLYIFEAYEEGNFQRGCNKYTKALERLRHIPEYAEFDWRRGFGKEYEEVQKLRKTIRFKEILRQALNSKFPKQKYIVTKQYSGQTVYLTKRLRGRIKWGWERKDAKCFNYKADAENLKKDFYGGDNFNVEEA